MSSTLSNSIRQAEACDVSRIFQLVIPSMRDGSLLLRTCSYFEHHINQFFVLGRKEEIYGCVQFRSYNEQSGELACLAVTKSMRNMGYGEQLLDRVVEEARRQNKNKVFALTTKAGSWFLERGFKEVSVMELPLDRLMEYQSSKRHSKILVKNI
ncbi:MAG: GNAT family N-acetyltransferase [Neisseriaceae bacterium]